MKKGDKFTVQTEAFFDNLTDVLYPVGTKNHERFIKEHRKWANTTLTVAEKVGFEFSVEENDLLWDSGKVAEFYVKESEV